MNIQQFKNIDQMVLKYKSCWNRQDDVLEKLDNYGFVAFVYNLDKGQFEITQFNTLGLVADLLSCSQEIRERAGYVVNNIPYRLKAFISILNHC